MKNTQGHGKNAVHVVEDDDVYDGNGQFTPHFLKAMFGLMKNNQAGGSEAEKKFKVRDDGPLELKFEMPGLGKEDVSVSVEKKNVVVITGTAPEAEEGDVFEAKDTVYFRKIPIPTHLYKVDMLKAEMKNGMLKIVIPQVINREKNMPIAFNVPLA